MMRTMKEKRRRNCYGEKRGRVVIFQSSPVGVANNF
jgi:hypothetical protein